MHSDKDWSDGENRKFQGIGFRNNAENPDFSSESVFGWVKLMQRV